VATTAGNDPFTTSNDPGDLLDSFDAWASPPTSGFGVTHDVASLWSARNFTGSTIAWHGWMQFVPASSITYWRIFGSNADLLRVLQAHEMGHNFGADHGCIRSSFYHGRQLCRILLNGPPASITTSIIIFASVSWPCQLRTPCSTIAAFTADPTEGCTPLQVFFVDLSQNNPTSWSLVISSGTPSSSTNQNPIFNYNIPGTFNVTLTVTNSQGSNT
jgi:hypothetical protein